MKARELIGYTKEQIWELENVGDITIEFDDGKVTTTANKTIYCWYLWEIHRNYPNLPILSRHHMGEERFTSKIHGTLLSNIYEDWCRTHTDIIYEGRDPLWKLIYEVVNWIYNDFYYLINDYIVGLDAEDLLDIVIHPDIVEANQNVRPTQNSIDETYDSITNTLVSSDSLTGNPIAEAFRSRLLDPKQVHQVVGPRGFVTEIDSTVFRDPITVGFAHGIRSLRDSLIESRSASKALMYAKDPLAACEYFNRELQLIAGVVRNLVPGDCGSRHTLDWTVRSSDLNFMKGIFYVDDDDQVKAITIKDTHLIDKTIQLRTPFGCMLEDRQGVCSTCYGELSHNMPIGTNIGHQAAIAFGEKISQLVLSTKHVDGSSKVDAIDLGEKYSKYLVPGSDDHTIRLGPYMGGKSLKLKFPIEEAKSLTDVYGINNLEDVSTTRFTEISQVTFEIIDDDGASEEITVPISMGSRLGSLTKNALMYVQRYKLDVDEFGRYIIDLSDWDHTYSLFELPLKHINMLDYQKEVQNMLVSSKRGGLASYGSISASLRALLDLSTSKININFTHVMVMAYAMSAANPKEMNYQLPRGGEHPQFITLSSVMRYRSLGALMAYETQEIGPILPESYLITDRPSHPLDELMMPQQ